MIIIMILVILSLIIIFRAFGLGTAQSRNGYTRSALEDSRLFGPSPWRILATTYEKNDF